ncbi:hypothetical protein BaRGS_00028193 [Batillaria attramentaria]|uniref:LAGLIDADG homing endonuclease n=1 Tax=Batillaria attramentaria TaxID=370345 RepID=A0ABD0K182_9CAEN
MKFALWQKKQCGYGSIVGAQKIGPVWRVYPQNNDARVKLLIDGLTLRGHTVSCNDKNPLMVASASKNGQPIRTTKLIIGNIPISFNNEDIEQTVIKLGCVPRSNLFLEKDRDETGALTRWVTGRRFIYIDIPPEPLPQTC